MEKYSNLVILKSHIKYSKIGKKVLNIKGRIKNLLPGTYKVFYKPTLLKRLILKTQKPAERYVIDQTTGMDFKVGESVRLEPDVLAYRVSVEKHFGKTGFQYAGMIKDTNLCDLLYVKGAMYGVIEGVSRNGRVAWVSRITK